MQHFLLAKLVPQQSYTLPKSFAIAICFSNRFLTESTNICDGYVKAKPQKV